MELKIGSVAKMTGLSPSGIRFLEEQGLLTPSGGRKGSYRSYGLADVSTLLDYRNYRQCGFSQEEILTLIRNEDCADDSAIFDQRCSELENEILQATRLLHFLRGRSQDASKIRDSEHFWELTERPAILWMPLKDSKGKLAEWPDKPGFDIPFADSVLKFSAENMTGSCEPLRAEIGIGMFETDILQSSFLAHTSVQYFARHPALHLIVEIMDDFSLGGSSLLRCRDILQEVFRRQNVSLSADHPVVSKRIITTRRSGKHCRYDHLWIDLDL